MPTAQMSEGDFLMTYHDSTTRDEPCCRVRVLFAWAWGLEAGRSCGLGWGS